MLGLEVRAATNTADNDPTRAPGPLTPNESRVFRRSKEKNFTISLARLLHARHDGASAPPQLTPRLP